MGATEHAPRGPFHLLERRDGLAEIVERGRAVVFVKRQSFLNLKSGPRAAAAAPRSSTFHVDKRGKDGILTHTDPKGDMPEDADTPTDA